MRALALLLPFLISGCLTTAAGVAGAASAGSASKAEANERIEYYIATEDPQPQIRRALKNREIVKGMNELQVKLVMDAKTGYSWTPDKTEEKEDGTEVWTYEYGTRHRDVKYNIRFGEDGIVESHNEK